MRPTWYLFAFLLAVEVSPCFAQFGSGAISLSFDPSVRSAGMGRATTAVFWGGDPNYWANPALLGHHDGLRYEWSEIQLVPDLADDVFFKSNRVTLAGWGFGVAFSVKPLRLDYGESEAIDSEGNPLGTFNSFEDIDSWGVGANLIQVTENVLRQFNAGMPAIARWGDVSVGYFKKSVVVDLAPASVLPDPVGAGSGRGEADTQDFGLLLRATPLNTIDYPIASQPHLPGLRLDVSYGRSWLNFDDAEVAFAADQIDPIARDARWGVGVRMAIGLSKAWNDALRKNNRGWVARLFEPIFSVGVAWDRSTYSIPGEPERLECCDTERWGVEFVFLNVFTLRSGNIDDPDGDVRGDTSGWGVGLNLGGVAGVRWDQATTPQAAGLDDVHPRGLTAFIDLVGLARLVRGDPRL
ncbi:MAG: hypothetical protein JSW67_07920 [Candidatus Latescibacterota bacterium]|nr:MAG: hypothetical protein JSW67_07920 [Candidatus Latescibacterota bacterium]